MNTYLAILIPAVIGFIGLLLIGFMFSRLYKRATRETAIIRTGVGGLEVIQDGGCFIIPGLHDMLRVNMKTMVIDVDGGAGLITQDSRRVDVKAQFFIRVEANREAIANAAQSLGDRTNDIDAIRSLLEGKVQDTMRSITAQMDLQDLHRSRSEFVQKVQTSLNDDLKPNGLVLESVALTMLDETDISKLDPNNTFDVIGLRRRAEIVTTQNKERASIEENGKVEVARAEQSARMQLLAIAEEEAKATESQSVAISAMSAEAQQKRARLNETTQQDLELAQTERRRAVETAEIGQKKEIELAEIERKQAIESAEIARRKEVELSQQKSDIEIENSSKAKSEAQAEANRARAEAVTAEEEIQTNRDTAAANREKNIAVINAEKTAEEKTRGILIAARVNREAAEDEATAVLTKSRADAEAVVILAEAEKEAGLAQAQATRAMVDAENSTSQEIIEFRLRMEMIKVLPQIISEMVSPARYIDSIKVNQFTGLGGLTGGSGGNGDSETSNGGGGMVDQLGQMVRVNTVALPVLRRLANDLDMDMGSGNVDDVLEGFQSAIAGKTPTPPKAAKTAKVAKVQESQDDGA